MGLAEVVTEVRNDGQKQAQEILAAARTEADGILAQARERAQAYDKQRQADAQRDAEQVLAQARSRAQSDARKLVLQAEKSLRDQLRSSVLDALTGLAADKRANHVKKLAQRATAIVTEGSIWGSSTDEAALKDAAPFTFGGTTEIAGGIIVESADGSTRLDLSYETLLGDLWRDVLRQEAELLR